jgi:hypothetical protein
VFRVMGEGEYMSRALSFSKQEASGAGQTACPREEGGERSTATATRQSGPRRIRQVRDTFIRAIMSLPVDAGKYIGHNVSSEGEYMSRALSFS